MVYLFREEEYRKIMVILLNNNKDDVLVEQLNNLGLKAHKCLITILYGK